jgi:hypothetical protein
MDLSRKERRLEPIEEQGLWPFISQGFTVTTMALITLGSPATTERG